MKLTKERLRTIIKEELAMSTDVNDKRDQIEDEYKKFTERGRAIDDEETLLIFATQLHVLTGLNANDYFEELAALYKKYVNPVVQSKAEVEKDLAALEARVRTDKPYMGSKEISSRKALERDISKHRMLVAILDKL